MSLILVDGSALFYRSHYAFARRPLTAPNGEITSVAFGFFNSLLGLIEKHQLTFDMLSDAGNDYAAELGLRFEIPSEIQAIYSGFGIDLPAVNGDASWTLPMPARIVVDRDGIVRAVDADPDYTRRPEPDKTLEDLKALGG